MGLVVAATVLSIPCAAQVTEFFPLSAGVKRFYRSQRKDTLTLNAPTGKQSFPLEASGSVVEEVTGTDSTLFGAAVTVVETRATETSARGQARSSTVITYYSAKPGAIHISGAKTSGTQSPPAGALQTYATPLLWLKLPLAREAAWDVGILRSEGTELTTAGQVAGMEDVTVPAGTYRGCWKVLYRHSKLAGELNLGSAKATADSGQGTTTVWLAPGIGPVKEVVELSGVFTLRPENQPGVAIQADVTLNRTKELTRVESPAP
jgi:hypothetical protein